MLQWLHGNISVQGADNGMIYGMYLNKTLEQQMFDPNLMRPVNTTYSPGEYKLSKTNTFVYVQNLKGGAGSLACSIV